MPGPAFLRGDRLTLRTVEPEDYGFVHEHWNDPGIRRWTDVQRPRTESEVADLIEDGDAIHFLACHDGGPVGFAWLFDVSETAGRAELGYWVIPEERGMGYATETAELVARYAFDERRFDKLVARAFEGNEASMRVLEKVGFEREGHLRDHYYVDGERVDAYLYGLLDR